jgi:uncharacterized oligopeptide transporter (OPT) family protein
LVAAALVILTITIRERLHPKYQPFVPNCGAIGLAWVIGQPQGYAFAMVFGAVLAYFVQRHRPKVWNVYGYPCAAGLAAGEACSGLVQAALVICEVDGDTVGSVIGVPFT